MTHDIVCPSQAFTTPEIQRVPLDLLTLQMMAMGLPDVKRFPFIEPPETKALDEALESLVVSYGLLNPLRDFKTIDWLLSTIQG